jgi:hypothetical protein
MMSSSGLPSLFRSSIEASPGAAQSDYLYSISSHAFNLERAGSRKKTPYCLLGSALFHESIMGLIAGFFADPNPVSTKRRLLSKGFNVHVSARHEKNEAEKCSASQFELEPLSRAQREKGKQGNGGHASCRYSAKSFVADPISTWDEMRARLRLVRTAKVRAGSPPP